jgi:hypothetical protein
VQAEGFRNGTFLEFGLAPRHLFNTEYRNTTAWYCNSVDLPVIK